MAGIALAFTILSYRRWMTTEDEGEALIPGYFQRVASRQSTTMELIVGAALPGVVAAYFDLVPFEEAALSSDELHTAATAMAADPSVADFRHRELVTRPVLAALVPLIQGALPRVIPSVLFLPHVVAALYDMPNHAPEVEGFRARLRMQSRACLVQLVASAICVTLSITLFASPEMVGPLTALLIGLSVHVLALESWRRALWRKLRVRLTLPEMAN